jgi:hypothetical protein
VAQLRQGGPQRCYLRVIQIGVQLAIESTHDVPQAVEHLLSCRGEFYDVDAPIGRVTPPCQQAICLHAVQMVGERCALDANLGSELPLIRLRLLLQGHEGEPQGT